MARELITGTDDEIVINLYKKDANGRNQTFVIDNGATVQARLRKRNTSTGHGPTFTLTHDANGADWSVSKVVLVATEAQTDTLTPDWYDIEVEVDNGGKLKWIVEGLRVIKGII